MGDESRDHAAASKPDEPAPVTPTEPGPVPPEPAAGDETVIAHGPPSEIGPSGTSVMPTVTEPAPPPRWSARAQVRPPEQQDLGGEWEVAGGSDWDEPPPRGRRSLAPFLITLLALVLLGILAFGIGLVASSRDTGVPVPVPTATANSAPPATTRPAAATTTAEVPTTAPTTAPALVAIPDVSGIDYDSAAAQLQVLGFQTKRVDHTSTTVAAGVVIATNPASGQVRALSSTVTIIVSSGAPTTQPAGSTPAATPTH
jgi:hypothetical protein